MDINALIQNAISQFVVNVPELILVISSVIYFLKGIKAKTATFPDIAQNTENMVRVSLSDTKDVVQVTLKETKDALQTILKETKDVLQTAFDDTTMQIVGIVKDTTVQIKAEVNDSLESMQASLTGYKEELQRTREQSNLLVQENKLFMDVICILLSQDPQIIKSGISEQITNKINMAKTEIEKYPERLVNDLALLQKTIIDTGTMIGQQRLNEVMDVIGYERKNT